MYRVVYVSLKNLDHYYFSYCDDIQTALKFYHPTIYKILEIRHISFDNNKFLYSEPEL